MFFEYEEPVYRPPSEASSLIIQATIGCSWNRCTFCGMYKGKNFRVRSMEEILSDINEASSMYTGVDRVFLADGNALCLPTAQLLEIMAAVKKAFPGCSCISLYASPGDILEKTPEELDELAAAGLKIIYLGIESGSPDVLKRTRKGASPDQIRDAGQRVVQSPVKLSVTLVSGLGGLELWEEHATCSARLLNEIQPDYLSLLTLMLVPGTVLYRQQEAGEFQPLSPAEILAETRLFISQLELKDCLFRSNHASNYVPIGGTLPGDRDHILEILDLALEGGVKLRPDFQRRL